MSADRELLELAAKAAGISIDKSPFNGGGAGNTGFDCLGNAILDWHNGVRWNPLSDDGDALRLATRLGLQVRQVHNAAHAGIPDFFWETERHGSDLHAATRRAIVRAAAHIARLQ